ncbi:MAG: hypothetical protein NTY88_15255 [Bacteroidetes bacterium]|nr:hypothetical protein [Bacteroidota bacterium]
METITLTLTSSKKKIDTLIQVAKEMGIKTHQERELTDEEMALPGANPTKKQLEEWLAKDEGESIPAEEAFRMVKEDLVKYRTKKKNGSTD